MGQFDPKDLCSERCQAYLNLLARRLFGPRPVRGVSSSDIVQQTLLKATKNLWQFQGETEAQLCAWMRQILKNTVADTFIGQPDEVPFFERSSQIEKWIKDSGPTPEQQAMREELLIKLAAAIERLSPAQRTAIEMRYLQEPRASLDVIARHLDRKTAKAVACLLAHGLVKLRGLLQKEELR